MTGEDVFGCKISVKLEGNGTQNGETRIAQNRTGFQNESQLQVPPMEFTVCTRPLLCTLLAKYLFSFSEPCLPSTLRVRKPDTMYSELERLKTEGVVDVFQRVKFSRLLELLPLMKILGSC